MDKNTITHQQTSGRRLMQTVKVLCDLHDVLRAIMLLKTCC